MTTAPANLNTHISLLFNGQSEAGFNYYVRCSGGTIVFMLVLGVKDSIDTERLFNALAENGAIPMPLQKIFVPCAMAQSPKFGIPLGIKPSGIRIATALRIDHRTRNNFKFAPR